jgi:hypothetical protein
MNNEENKKTSTDQRQFSNLTSRAIELGYTVETLEPTRLKKIENMKFIKPKASLKKALSNNE